jgi:hypothetical protein
MCFYELLAKMLQMGASKKNKSLYSYRIGNFSLSLNCKNPK